MAVDGGGRLEWAKKIFVWTTRFGVSFHVLPKSRRRERWPVTRANAFHDFNFSADSSWPPAPSPPLSALSPYRPTLPASSARPTCPPPPAPSTAQTCASGMRTVPRMLSTAKIRTGSWRYYADQVEHGACEYFLGLGEAPGRWYGRGLEPLPPSADPPLAEPELAAVFGRALPPVPPLQLRRGLAAVGCTRYHLTFSPPQTVWALWALGDEGVSTAVRKAHAVAVRTALDYLDGHAAFSRTGRDGAAQVGSDGFTAAVFDHRTSRAGD